MTILFCEDSISADAKSLFLETSHDFVFTTPDSIPDRDFDAVVINSKRKKTTKLIQKILDTHPKKIYTSLECLNADELDLLEDAKIYRKTEDLIKMLRMQSIK